MFFYHGTAFENLDTILAKGIHPRKGRGNWTKYPSHKKMVYLTTAYPFFFAACSKGEDHRVLVFEIAKDRLEEWRLHPDEDFIAQAKKDIEHHAQYVKDLLLYQEHWHLSVQHLGNLCHLGFIPAKALTRYCIFDMKKRPSIAMSLGDPCITLMNYQICGEYYREFIRWMFGDRETIPQKFDLSKITGGDNLALQMLRKDEEIWEKESANREGITVVTI